MTGTKFRSCQSSKIQHNFQDKIHSCCNYGLEVETSINYCSTAIHTKRNSGIKLRNSGLKIMNHFYMFSIKNSTSLIFQKPQITHILQNTNIKFLKLTKLQQKQQPKPDSLRLCPSLFIELAFFGFFYSKAKIKHTFSLHSSFDVLIFTLNVFLNDLPFLH